MSPAQPCAQTALLSSGGCSPSAPARLLGTPLFPQVRFSPNLDSQGWLVSGGQAGIVRAHCLAGLASGVSHQLLPECQARFSVLYGDTPSSPARPEHSLLPAE